MRIPAPVWIVTLIGLAAGSWWLANRGVEAPEVSRAGGVPQPGYYLKDALLTQTDETGRQTLRVHADTASQRSEHGPVDLQQLEIHYYPAAGQDWLMTSNAGSIPPEGKTVLLQGDVRLRAAAAAAATGAVVRSEHLLLDIDRQLATTADPVRIQFQPHEIRARGLRADLKHETLRLESAVNGKFTR